MTTQRQLNQNELDKSRCGHTPKLHFWQKPTLPNTLIERWVEDLGEWAPPDLKDSPLLKKNLQRDIKRLNYVVSNLDSVTVSETIGEKNKVITLTSSDGMVTSLWLWPDGRLKSISPY